MKKNKNFKTRLKKIVTRIKNLGNDADYDWRMILFVFLCSLIAVLALHVRIFTSTEQVLSSIETRPVQEYKVFDFDMLSQSVSAYKQREEEYKKIQNTQLKIIDPAL